MLTILQGENELARQEALSSIMAKAHLTLDLKALNTETHEGPPTLGELRQACSTLPFLGDKRIIIYNDALGQIKGPLVKEIADYMSDLPPTTHLIFVETHILPKKHAVVAWAEKNEGKVVTFAFPKKIVICNNGCKTGLSNEQKNTVVPLRDAQELFWCKTLILAYAFWTRRYKS